MRFHSDARCRGFGKCGDRVFGELFGNPFSLARHLGDYPKSYTIGRDYAHVFRAVLCQIILNQKVFFVAIVKQDENGNHMKQDCGS